MNRLTATVPLMTAAAFVLSAASPPVWVFDTLTRITPTTVAGTQTQMTIYAGRGEVQSFQIGVQAPSGGLSNVNVTASALAGPGGATIPAANLSLFREQFVPIASGQTSPKSFDGNGCTECPLGPNTYPDGLIPFVDPDTGLPLPASSSIVAVPFALTAGQDQAIWVDVNVPRTASPGIYNGTLTITSDQGQSQVSLVLNVWNFTLPLQPSEKSAFLVWNNAHKPATDKELMRNRLMPDTTVTVAEASTLKTNYGLGAYGIQWYSNTGYGDCNATGAPPTTSEAAAAAAPLQQLGLLVYDYSFDEIDACTNLYPTIIQWAQNLHKAGVDQLITMAPVQALFDDGLGTGRSAVDIWVMEPDVYVTAQSQNPPMATAAMAKGDQVWAYQGLVEDDYSPKWLIDFAPVGIRTFAGFLSQSLGFTGLLYWKVDGWLSGTGAGSWTDVFYKESGNYYPGEALFVYPGEAVGMPGKVAPSMRLKQLRDGEQDYEYIQLLKNLGQGAYALQVASGVASSYSNWSQNPATLQAARIALGQKLDSLSGGGSQVSISANPSSLEFAATVNGPASPASENIAVSASSGSANVTVATATSSGSWLAATTSQGSTPVSVGIMANPSNLAAGTYPGSVTVSAAGTSPVTVPVTLTVTAAPVPPPSGTITVSPSVLTFSAHTGASAIKETLSVSASNGTAMSFTASASMTSGSGWLTVKNTGTTPDSLKVTANATNLRAGTYSGSVTIVWSTGKVTIPVTFTVTSLSPTGR